MGSLEISPTLLGLLQHYSPSAAEAEAATWLVNHMLSLGAKEAFLDPAGNPVGKWGDGPRQIVLLGHIDTVPGEIPIRREGDLIYGRGAVDAKGPLAAFVDAASTSDGLPGWQVIVVGAVREETDSGGAHYITSQYHPAYTIIGEPNHWQRIALGYKGNAWANLTIQQKTVHSAYDHPSACETILHHSARLADALRDFNTGRTRAFDQLQVSLRGFSSGETGFEEWASLKISVRLPLDLPPDEFYHLLETKAAPALVERIGKPIPAFLAAKNTPLVRAFLGAIRAYGGQPSFVLKSGTADMNIVAPAWGCPALTYGPGDSALDHTPNEHLSLAEYVQSVSVLQMVLRTLTHPD